MKQALKQSLVSAFVALVALALHTAGAWAVSPEPVMWKAREQNE